MTKQMNPTTTSNFPTFTKRISENLKKTSLEAFNKAVQLLEDAELLFDRGRHSSAGSLSILSFEEFSKSFILFICEKNRVWNRDIYNILSNHTKKQAILYGAMCIAPTIFLNSTVQFGMTRHDSSDAFEKYKNIFIEKQYLDKIKQILQFVPVNKDGTCNDGIINSKQINIGIYIAKIAFYIMKYFQVGTHTKYVEQISKGCTIEDACMSAQNRIIIGATHTIYFRDSTACSIYFQPDYNEMDISMEYEQLEKFVSPVVSRAHAILEGRAETQLSSHVRLFWQQNQDRLNIEDQLEQSKSELGYRYSPYLETIREVL